MHVRSSIRRPYQASLPSSLRKGCRPQGKRHAGNLVGELLAVEVPRGLQSGFGSSHSSAVIDETGPPPCSPRCGSVSPCSLGHSCAY